VDSKHSERVVAPTEERNGSTTDIDLLPTLEVLRLLNAEDATVPRLVAEVLPALAEAVDLAVAAVLAGGRVHYFGAGTSGRVAVMDAAELLPTFGLDHQTVVAHHAGGLRALAQPAENAEDDSATGGRDAAQLTRLDVAVGLTASGRTPYVGGALRGAREAGAATVLVSANPAAELAALADVHIGVDTGPEAIAGSTRLKAATAQKLVINGFSTALAVRLGRTYSNLMVDVMATNAKLRGRLVTILQEATGRPAGACTDALAEARGELKTALVSLLAGCSVDDARRRLEAASGNARLALADGGPAPVADGNGLDGSGVGARG